MSDLILEELARPADQVLASLFVGGDLNRLGCLHFVPLAGNEMSGAEFDALQGPD